MTSIGQIAVKGSFKLDLAKNYLSSYYESLKLTEFFKDVKTFCMFIGYPRSGSTLIGSLLDAHPNIIIAHELDVFRYIRAGFNKRQISRHEV